jgi:TetR/AcrR family transcriptional repressor of nem operon
MPWPKDHKTKTRERIVAAAAQAFRRSGATGVGVEEIMATAGLTHGGFYSHFESKDALLEAALKQASHETIERLSEALGAERSERALRAVIDTYLSPEHVEHPERGCPVAALGAEVARAGGTTKRSLARGVRERLGWMLELFPSRRRGGRADSDVTGTFACMVGGLILARIASDKDSADILQACRTFLHRALDHP